MSGSHNNQLLPPNWNKTSKLRQEKIAKRLAENGSKSKTLDIDSIRARRARLEALTKSMRSPTNDKRSSSMVPSAKNVKLSPIGTPSPNKLDKKRRDDVLLKKAKPSTDKSDPKSSSKYEEELLAKWKRERVIGDDSRRSSIKEYTDDEEPKEEEEEDDAEEEEEEEDEEEDEDEESEDYDSRSSTTYGDTSSNDGSMLEQPTEKTVRDIVKQIKARTEDERLMGVYRARKHLSIETEPPFDIYINAGIIGPLVSCLSTYNPNLQFEAAWALTNIASGSSEHAMALYEGGAVPELIILLNSPYNRVSDQCVWALGNLAGDSDFLWQVVVEEGAIRPLYNLIEKSPSLASLRNLSWAFSNILRHKPLSLSHSDFVLCLKAVRLFLHHPDKEIHLNGCWSLVYITDNGNDKIEDVLKAGVLPRIVEELLDTNDKKTVTPAIRVLGNIMTGTDEQTEQVVNSGVVPILVRHLDHPSCNIRKDCAWALSNITAGTEDQIQTVIDADALQQLKVVINTTRWSHPRVRLHSPKPEVNTTTEQLIHGSRHTDDSGVKKEAVWCVSNLTQSGNQKQVDEVIHTDLLAAMVNSIKKKGEVGKQQLHVTFEGINNVLEKTSHPKKAARIILKSLPLKDIEGYTYDSEKRIAAVAAKLHLSLSEHSDEH